METSQKNIKKRLRILLKILNLDIETTSKKLGYTKNKVKSLRTAHQKVTPEIANDFKNVFNVNPTWLIFGTGEMFSSESFEEKKYEALKQSLKEICLEYDIDT